MPQLARRIEIIVRAYHDFTGAANSRKAWERALRSSVQRALSELGRDGKIVAQTVVDLEQETSELLTTNDPFPQLTAVHQAWLDNWIGDDALEQLKVETKAAHEKAKIELKARKLAAATQRGKARRAKSAAYRALESLQIEAAEQHMRDSLAFQSGVRPLDKKVSNHNLRYDELDKRLDDIRLVEQEISPLVSVPRVHISARQSADSILAILKPHLPNFQ